MRRLTAALLAAALTAAALLASSVRAQAPSPTPRPPRFEAGVEIINLTLSITDGRSRYITDLREKDLLVYEDGIRQEVALFTHEQLPVSLVLMIDTSSSMDQKLTVAQEAAVRFTKTLRPQDLARVVQFGDRSTTLQDFTADQAALEAAIRSTKAGGATALYNAIYVALKELERQKRTNELRRRAIVLLSDGEDSGLSVITDEQVLELARKTEIGIYAIGMREKVSRDLASLKFSQATHLLTALARDTGAQVFFPNSLSELDAIYGNIAEELRSQYSLGYASQNRKRDGKWRRIVVRTPSRDDLQIRHRLGYYAPKG
ncbi:MAG TPA: VWA domain-containing protein [Vicinamibacteria bacterium]|nr:VWA domain-containing protein [Vicinamibacteria bacterium]